MKVTQLGKYSVDIEVDYNVDIENELSNILVEEIRKEIDKETTNKVHQQMLTNQGWHCVMIKNYKNISEDWCKKYIKGSYRCFDHYWYFEDIKDANYFTLKWSTA